MKFLAAATAVALALTSSCQATNLVVKSTGGNVTSDIQYGIMHEDINNSGDGGIYAELIRNRAFQGSNMFPTGLSGWHSVNGAVLSIKNLSTPLSWALPSSMNVAAGSKKKGRVGFANDGFWGMDVRVQPYTGSFYVKGEYKGHFTASLQSALTNETFGSVNVKSKSVGDEWTQHEFVLTPTKDAPNTNNTFAITFNPCAVKGLSLDFNLISLFPPTYKNRKNGLRPDIMEDLAALNPKFLRLPGGNMLEGNIITEFWKWNETIGDLKNRPGMANVWNYEITYGLGLVEYMEWCDDLNIEPIVAVFAGLSLDGDYIKEEDLQPYIDYALDEIEFLTGDESTKWGKVRASLGYPKPWKVRYVEIGNEDWLAGRPTAFEAYKQYRFPRFLEAFNKRFPEIRVIASPSIFDDMTIPAQAAGDYHAYLEPDTFLEQFNRFDQLTKDNLTLIGEYASVHPNGGIGWDGLLMPFPWWGGTVGEAIFLLGVERNGDRIIGNTYAPGLRNLNRWQWSVTLMQHSADPKQTTRSTSWYLLKLFGNHVITKTLPVTSDTNFGPLFYVAGEGEQGTGIFKAAVYNSTSDVPVSLQFEGFGKGTTAQLTVLTGPEDPYGYNDPYLQNNVVKEKVSTVVAGDNGVFEFTLPQLSIAVLETDAKKKRAVTLSA